MRLCDILSRIKRRGFFAIDGGGIQGTCRMRVGSRFFSVDGSQIVYLYRANQKKRHHK